MSKHPREYLVAALDDEVNRGDMQAVWILVEQGADVNGRDICGDTPLLSASWVGATEIARFLIACGADVNAVGSEGKTPLRIATENEHADVAHILADAGARL